MSAVSEQAVKVAMNSCQTFCKFLAANDVGSTGAHQSGLYIPKHSASELVQDFFEKGQNKKYPIDINWQTGVTTHSVLTYYGKNTRDECRITRFQRSIPFFKDPQYVGSLCILCKNGSLASNEFNGFILNSDDEIDDFFDAFGISPIETNKIINTQFVSEKKLKDLEEEEISSFVNQWKDHFPSTIEMSAAARKIQSVIDSHDLASKTDPDSRLIAWTEEEYVLFKALEESQFGDQVHNGFVSIDSFLEVAKSIMNRRKSRAGKSFEHHIEALFDEYGLKYTAQGVTELNKRPDFIFPSIEAYKDPQFPTDKLILLGAKTTCKDRWRQVITEADRLKNNDKFLITLQQGISKNQLQEMKEEHVILVVPEKYIKTYPAEFRKNIWTLKKFINFIKDLEKL